MIRAFGKIRHYHSALGLSGVIAFIFAKILGRRLLFKARVAGIKHQVYLRIGTTDVSVLRQVLVEKHYDMSCPTAPKIIVDAGANIGLSAVFFANKFPDAAIIVLEPESSNFQLLKKNVLPYPQVRLLQAALWKEDRQISLIDPNKGDHGFQIMEKSVDDCEQSGLVPALTLNTLMSNMGLNSIDLLKIDVEGAEKEIFENSSKWIDKVEMIMVELHDDLKPGCSEAFKEATKAFSREFSKGETVMCFRPAKMA